MSLQIVTSASSSVGSPVPVQEAFFQLSSVAHDGAELMNLDLLTGDVTFASAPPQNTLAWSVYAMSITADVEFIIRPADPLLMTVTDDDLEGGPQLMPLCAGGVYVFADNNHYPYVWTITIVYDPSCSTTTPYRGYDAEMHELPIKSEHLLAFGLGWAFRWFLPLPSDAAPPTPTDPPDYDFALEFELSYRSYRNEPERFFPRLLYSTDCPDKPHMGVSAQSQDPPEKASHKGGETSSQFWASFPHCFVATAAYGGPDAPEVEFLRAWRDDILIRTRAGSDFFHRFYERYSEFSVPLAQAMSSDSDLLVLMRTALAEPILRWLRLAIDFPDAGLEAVPEPWGSFLLDLRSSLERWADCISAPDDFNGLSVTDAARELAIFLRFKFRDPVARNTYLERLERAGVLPLLLHRHDADEACAVLRDLGRSEQEIARVVAAR